MANKTIPAILTNEGNVGIGISRTASLNTTTAVNGTGGGNREFVTFTGASSTGFTGTDNADQGYGYFAVTIVSGKSYEVSATMVVTNGATLDWVTSTVLSSPTVPVQIIQLEPVSNTTYRFAAIGNATFVGVGFSRTSGTMTAVVSNFSIKEVGSTLVTSESNVGIGTTSPLKLLHVHGPTGEVVRLSMASSYTAGHGPQLSFWNATTEDLASIRGVFNETSQGNRANLIFGTRTSDALGIETKMTILHDGNVGIGITTPNAKLQIAGTTASLLTVGTLTNDWGGVVAIGTIDGNGIILSKVNTANDTNRVLTLMRDDTNGASIFGYTPVGTSTSVGFQIRASASSYFNGGNVGIGTTNPATKLHVYSAGGGFEFGVGSSNCYIETIDRANTSAFINTSYYTRGTGYFAWSNGSYTERMRIDDAGNVGIGTTVPTYRLDIEGVSTTSVVQNVRNPSTSWNQYALTRYQTDTKNSRYVDVGYFRGVSNEDTRGFVISGLSSNILTLLEPSAYLGLGGVTAPLFNIDVASTQGKGIQLRYDTTTAYLAQITPYWNSSTDTRIDFAINRTANVTPSVIMSVGYDSKVGIGTTAPTGTLTIQSNSNQLRLQTATGPGAYFTNISSFYDSTHPFAIEVANNSSSTTEYFGIYSDAGGANSRPVFPNGNVGIGTTRPSGKLTVQGNIEVNYNSTTADTSVRRSFLTTHATINRGANITFGLFDGGSNPMGMTVYNVAAAAGAYNSQFIAFYTHEGGVNEGERMRITQSGNVGIGTFTPLSLLTVGEAGSTSAAKGLSFGGDASANLYRLAAGQVKTDGQLVAVGGFYSVATAGNYIETLNIGTAVIIEGGVGEGLFLGDSSRWMIGTSDAAYTANADGDLHFRDNTNSVTRMIINYASGFVGIGTTSPYEKLDVRGGILRTNTRVSNTQLYPLGHYSAGEPIFEIDPSWSEVELQRYFNSSNVTWVAVADAPGGYCIYINGAVEVGAFNGSGFPYIPVDTDDIFYMECWIQNVGLNQTHYMGSQDLDHNFSNLGGNPGSYGYFVMINSNPTTTWTKVSGYIGGFSATVNGKFEIGTKYWSPMALFNYTAGTGTRACRISGWKVIKVYQPGNRYFSGNIGIGTTSPGTLLQVHGANPFVRINNTAADDHGIKISYNNSETHGLNLIYNANSAVSYIDNTYPVTSSQVYGDIYFRQNVAGTMTTRMTIKGDGGNVGIGTTSPTQKLDIVGSYGAPDDNAGILKIKGPGVGPTQLNFGISGDGGYAWIQATNISIDNDRDIILGPLGGNIGIGTVTPLSLLTVGAAGSTTAAKGLSFGGDAQANLYRSAEDTVKTDGNLIVVGNATTASLDVAGTIRLSSNLLSHKTASYTTPYPGISSFGADATDSSITYYDTGKTVPTTAIVGVVWTGKHYIFTSYASLAYFYDNNFNLITNSYGFNSLSLPRPSGYSYPHGAAWDGRYLWTVCYVAGETVASKIVGYDLDGPSGNAAIIAESAPLTSITAAYDIEYADGHLYIVRSGNVYIYRWNGSTIDLINTILGEAGSITAQAITYDGSWLWVTQDNASVYKLGLDGYQEAVITSGFPPSIAGWAWNGSNIVTFNRSTLNIYIINTTRLRIDTRNLALMGGNVGIGITNPLEKLHVTGYILTRSKLAYTQTHDIVKNGLSFYVDFNNKTCFDANISSTSIKDLSNNGYTLNLVNVATIGNKDGNTALYTANNASYLQIVSYVIALPHTWEAWVNGDAFSSWDTIWDSNTERPLIGTFNGVLQVYPSATNCGTLAAGKWYHIVVTTNASSVVVTYINGLQTATFAYASTFRTGTGDYWLGGDVGAETFNGYIPIARTYNRVLSATEVMQNYNIEKWRFDSSSTFYHDVADGNVGIGTTNPLAPLHVGLGGDWPSSTGTSAMVFIKQKSSNVGLVIQEPGNASFDRALHLYTNGSLATIDATYRDTGPYPDIAFVTSGTERVRINSAGNVLIGTTTSTANGGLLQIGQVPNTTASSIGFNNEDNAVISAKYNLVFQIDNTNSVASRAYEWNKGGKGYGDGTNLMTLNAAGKLGIGTVTPLSLLTVGPAGSTSPASGITFGGDAEVNLYRISENVLQTDAAFNVGGSIYSASYFYTAVGQIYGSTYGNLTFFVGNSAGNAWQEGMFIKRGSYVGIGTTNPTGKLHIVSSVAGETVLRADGTNGTLFSVVDDLSDSLFSVNNSAGLPVLEVFADDRVVAGQYGSGDFVLINNKVGLGTSNPTNKLTVIGGASIGSSTYNLAAPSNGLIVEGNVGIGTTNPAYKLDVSASVIDVGRFYNNQTALVLNVGSTNNTEYTDLALFTSNGNAQFFKQRSSTSWGGADSLNIYTSNGAITFHPANTPNAVYIDSNGSVGINKTAPTTKLDVVGSFRVVGTTNVGGIFVTGSSATQGNIRPAVAGGTVLISDDSGSSARGLTVSDGGGVIISSVNASYDILTLQIGGTTNHNFDRNGNVGIGLSAPNAARLHIKGNDSDPVLRVESASLVAGTTTASKTFVAWLPIMTGSAAGDKVFIPLFKN